MSPLMFLMRSRRYGEPGLALARAVGLAVVGASLQAGEPIEFSTPSSQNSVPSVNPKESLPDRDPHLFRPGGDGPVMDLPVTSQPEVVPSKRRMQEFWEKRDREKNWIFVPPSEFGATDRSAERMFDVETPEESTRPIKGSRVMERFWQSQDTRDRPKARIPGEDSLSRRGGNEAAAGAGSLLGQASREARGKTSLDWGMLFEESRPGDLQKSSAKDSLGGLFDQSGRSLWLLSDDVTLSDRSRSGSNNRKESLGDFQRLLKAQPLTRGWSGASDPVNTAIDSTRQPINPVVSRGLRDPTESFQIQNSAGGLPGVGFGSAGNSVSSFADMNGNGLNPASRSPSLFQSAEPVGVTPKPATFEFPKRKF